MSYLSYHALCDARREPHFVTGLHLIEKVSPSLQEAEHGVEQAIDTLAGLLSDGEEEVIVSLINWVSPLCSRHFNNSLMN